MRFLEAILEKKTQEKLKLKFLKIFKTKIYKKLELQNFIIISCVAHKTHKNVSFRVA